MIKWLHPIRFRTDNFHLMLFLQIKKNPTLFKTLFILNVFFFFLVWKKVLRQRFQIDYHSQCVECLSLNLNSEENKLNSYLHLNYILCVTKAKDKENLVINYENPIVRSPSSLPILVNWFEMKANGHIFEVFWLLYFIWQKYVWAK